MEHNTRPHTSPTGTMSVPSEPPEPHPKKKKRKSPLLSKAKSCLGCRNAKLRCDMNWPCANCVRRGLTHDCPGFVPHAPRTATSNHSTSSNDSAKSLADLARTAATIQLQQDSLSQLDAVVQANTLANAQTLTHDVLSSSPPPTMQRQVDTHSDSSVRQTPTAPAARPQYYGQSAHSSYLASNFSPPADPASTPPPTAPAPVPASQPPQLTPQQRGTLTSSKRARTDPQDSWVQLDSDYTHFLDNVQKGMDESIATDFQASIAWMFCPVQEAELSSVFHSAEHDTEALCLLVKVVMFAWKAAGQREHPASSERIGEVAFQQCWRALDKAQWSRTSSLPIQQALFLLCIYVLNFEGGHMSDRFSSVFGVCVAKAIESGLYTDAKVGQVDDPAVQRQRSRLFWELYSLDAFRSLAYCRPCFFQDATISAAKPAVLSDDDAFHAIKYENAQIINRFMTHHIHSFRTNFQETMDLDHQVRQLFERIPHQFRIRRASRLSSGKHQTVRQILQGCTIALNIHQTLLTLYRPWFVSHTLEELQAKADRHSAQYQRAKLCIGESASAMIDLCSRAYSVDPQTTMHWAFFLHHTFNAGVCRAMQAIYGNASDPLYYSAVDDVDEAMALLERTREHGLSQVWLPKAHVLRKLRQRIDRLASGATRRGEQSRRASHFGLLGATVPIDPDPSSIIASAEQQHGQHGQDSYTPAVFHGGDDVTSATPDDAASTSGWLDMLNTDAFTLYMSDLWNVDSLSMLEAPVAAQSTHATWSTPL